MFNGDSWQPDIIKSIIMYSIADCFRSAFVLGGLARSWETLNSGATSWLSPHVRMLPPCILATWQLLYLRPLPAMYHKNKNTRPLYSKRSGSAGESYVSHSGSWSLSCLLRFQDWLAVNIAARFIVSSSWLLDLGDCAHAQQT